MQVGTAGRDVASSRRRPPCGSAHPSRWEGCHRKQFKAAPYPPRGPEAAGPNATCRRAAVPLKAAGKEPLQAGLLVPVARAPLGVQMAPFFCCLHVAFPLCLAISVSKCPLLRRTPVLALGSTHPNNCVVCNGIDPISKEVCRHRCCGLELGGDTN